MHTRVDILLCSQKSEEELLSVAERIHEALSCLEKTANYYDPASESLVNNSSIKSDTDTSKSEADPIVVNNIAYSEFDYIGDLYDDSDI